MVLRAAILGCGGIARKHADVLSKNPDITLIAFCDVVENNAKIFNQTYANSKGNVYTDYTKMFEREKLDLVYICIPPFAHCEEVKVASESGTNIFIEKPIALDLELAKKMVAWTEKYDVKTQVGFMLRFGTAVEYMKELLDTGKAGQPVLFIGRYFCNSLHSWWWRDRSKSGGQVVEQVIHVYDLSRYLIGEPKSVFCKMDNILHRKVENYTAEDVSTSFIRFNGGSIASISATNCAIPRKWIFDIHFVTEKYTAYISGPNKASIVRTDVEWENLHDISSNVDTYEAETIDLINSIKEDRPARIPMIEGARSLSLVLSARKSAEQGAEVKIEAI